MRKAERLTKITLAILIVLSIVAIVLQIINQKTDPIETAYEIITFSVAIVALSLAITQGISNARTSNELREIARDINQVLKVEKADLARDNKLAKKLGGNQSGQT